MQTERGDRQLPPLVSHSPYQLQPPLNLAGGLGGDGMRCLLVRHLPSWLSREEKESLFGHFGAQEVVVMPNKGKMVVPLTVCKQSTGNYNKS